MTTMTRTYTVTTGDIVKIVYKMMMSGPLIPVCRDQHDFEKALKFVYAHIKDTNGRAALWADPSKVDRMSRSLKIPAPVLEYLLGWDGLQQDDIVGWGDWEPKK